MKTTLRLLKTAFAALSIAIAVPAMAQTHYDSRVYFGAKAGADISQVSFSPRVKQSFKPGMTAGVRVRYVEESHFGLVAELDFIQRGWQEKFEDGEDFSYSRTLNYLEIPVLAHVYFGRRGHFFFNAGPQIGFLLGHSAKGNFDLADPGSTPGFPKNRRTAQITMEPKNKVDFGISAGLGAEFFATPKHSVDVEVRFYYGLGNIFGARRTDVFSASNQMSFSFTAGYWFRSK